MDLNQVTIGSTDVARSMRFYQQLGLRLIVDSAVFLQLAFGDLTYIWGQIVGKAWMVLFAIPFIAWLRARDERLGLAPA